MKHMVLILSLFVIGCTPKGGPEQMLRMKDGREIECRLLSIRANGLVVDTAKPLAYHITNAEAGLYPFESIDKFVYDPVSASKSIILGSVSGLVVGTGVWILAEGHDAASNILSSESETNSSVTLYTALGCMAAGALTAIVVNEINYYNYDPAIPEDREQIFKLAIYKTVEPDELKKIK
jgi:hypothetical protein